MDYPLVGAEYHIIARIRHRSRVKEEVSCHRILEMCVVLRDSNGSFRLIVYEVLGIIEQCSALGVHIECTHISGESDCFIFRQVSKGNTCHEGKFLCCIVSAQRLPVVVGS